MEAILAARCLEMQDIKINLQYLQQYIKIESV